MSLSNVPLPPEVPRPEMWDLEAVLRAINDGFTFLLPFRHGESLFSPNAYWIGGVQAAASGLTMGPDHTPERGLLPDGWLWAHTFFPSEMVPRRSWLDEPSPRGLVKVQLEIDPDAVDWELLNRGYQIRTPRMGAAEPSSLKSFGQELREFLNEDDVFAILEGGDWGFGGCWILAEALARWLGPIAEVVAVSEDRKPSVHLPVSHVAVRFDETYIDYNGAQTEAEFLANLRAEGYQNPKIVTWTKKRERLARKVGVPCKPWQVERLVSKLNQRFPEE